MSDANHSMLHSGDKFHGRFSGPDFTIVDNPWLDKHIRQNHGPLGAEHPHTEYLMEGDTPSFLGLVDNGLNNPERPDFGGWGGRYEYYLPKTEKWFFEPETRPLWTNAVDEFYSPWDNHHHTSNHVTIWRWREEFQNDFAARMDWCIKNYEEANHPPVPVLGHPDHLTVKSGEGFSLDASGSTDPDGDNLSFLWFDYPEAGSYKKAIDMGQPENAHARYLTAPEVDREETIHIILQVTDKGTPALTRYKRVIVHVVP